MMSGTRKQILTDEIPPKMPNTAETLGKTIDKKQVKEQNAPQIIQLAFVVNSGVP